MEPCVICGLVHGACSMAWRSPGPVGVILIYELVNRGGSGVELIGQVYLRYYGISTIPRYLYQAAAAFQRGATSQISARRVDSSPHLNARNK